MMFLREPRSRQTIERRQLRRLKTLVYRAYERSPRYRKFYDTHNFHPDHLRSLTDLSRIPIVDREFFGESIDTETPQLFTRTPKKTYWSQTTSGSSGFPIRIVATRAERLRILFGILRSYRIAGMSLRDQTLVIKDPIDIRKRNPVEFFGFLRHRYYSIYEPIEQIVRQVIDSGVRVDILKSMPSDLANLVVHITAHNLDFRIRKAIFSDSETLDQPTRDAIQTQFRVPVFDFYANTETGIAAFQSPHSLGRYLIPDDLVILETLPNPHLEPGDYDIVLTGLINRTTPIIRYRIGDVAKGLATFDSDASVFPSIEGVYGKYLDFLVRPDRSVVSSHVIKQNLTHIDGIKRFQVAQEVDGRVIVSIEPNSKWTKDVLAKIEADFRRDIGADLNFQVILTNELGAKTGGYRKFKVVESLLAQRLIAGKFSAGS